MGIVNEDSNRIYNESTENPFNLNTNVFQCSIILLGNNFMNTCVTNYKDHLHLASCCSPMRKAPHIRRSGLRLYLVLLESDELAFALQSIERVIVGTKIEGSKQSACSFLLSRSKLIPCFLFNRDQC